MMELTDTVTRFSVTIPTLKRLIVGNGSGESCKHELMVDAPNLEHFHLLDSISENLIFKNFLSISKVELEVNCPLRNLGQDDAHGVHGNLIVGLLGSISAVKTLILSKSTMTALGCANNKVLPTFHNLNLVSFEVDEVFGWQLLPSFLQSMPNLRVLVFARGLVPDRRWRASWMKDHPFKFNWQAPKVVPVCLLLTLQTIEIRNDGPLMKKELKLIKYLLANAMCLKTMKICRSEMDEKTRKKLASYRRGSDSCQIILLKPNSDFWSRALPFPIQFREWFDDDEYDLEGPNSLH